MSLSIVMLGLWGCGAFNNNIDIILSHNCNTIPTQFIHGPKVIILSFIADDKTESSKFPEGGLDQFIRQRKQMYNFQNYSDINALLQHCRQTLQQQQPLLLRVHGLAHILSQCREGPFPEGSKRDTNFV